MGVEVMRGAKKTTEPIRPGRKIQKAKTAKEKVSTKL
jgi:hypothetical protein